MQRWTDDFLQWDPGHYGNITQLVLTGSHIWLPEIAMYNRYCILKTNNDRFNSINE